jgi:hypothetical protein
MLSVLLPVNPNCRLLPAICNLKSPYTTIFTPVLQRLFNKNAIALLPNKTL